MTNKEGQKASVRATNKKLIPAYQTAPILNALAPWKARPDWPKAWRGVAVPRGAKPSSRLPGGPGEPGTTAGGWPADKSVSRS